MIRLEQFEWDDINRVLTDLGVERNDAWGYRQLNLRERRYLVERIIGIIVKNSSRHLHHQVVTSQPTPTAQPPTGGPR